MSDDSLLDQQLDEYRLVSLLGQGGMARVFLGLDVHLRRHVAIKVIDTSFRADSTYVERFEREAQAVAQLQHPHIVTLYRFGESAGQLYMAMQYIEGADLEYLLGSYRADGEYMDLKDIGRIVREVCEALDYAHDRGIIHRDVKPSNVMLDRNGWPYLTDFGLALLVESGTRGEIFGSPHYIAPEQAISSAAAVPQSDLYALGVVLYEMVTNRVPFEAETPLDTAMLHVSEAPPPPRGVRPEIGSALEDVILKAMTKEPEGRYQSGAELAKALDRALRRAPVSAPSPIASLTLTIPERVAIEAGEQSLALAAVAPPPPVPAADLDALEPAGVEVAPVLPNAEAGSPAAPVRIPSLLARIPSLLHVGLALGACVAISVLAGWLWLAGQQDQEEGQRPEVASVTSSAKAVLDTALPRPIATLDGAPTELAAYPIPPVPSQLPLGDSPLAPTVAPVSTPSPTLASSPTVLKEEPVSYDLMLALKGKDGVFVINRGAAPFPLLPLGLGDGAIEGWEWNVALLKPGECVAAWKEKGEPRPPAELVCSVVGEVVRREGDVRFWRGAFEVTYGGRVVGACEKEQDECPVTVQVEGWCNLYLPLMAK